MKRRLAPAVAVALAVAATLGVTTGTSSAASSASAKRAQVFAGIGAWIDIYDATIRQPRAAVAAAAAHGVKTIYVETSNYHSPADVMYPASLRTLVRLAHAQGIKVVPWYLPGYRSLALDQRRFKAAVGIGGTEKVDGLGLDVEADIGADRDERAARAGAMARWVRGTFPTLPLAGIVPRDALAWWVVFPYADVRAATDAMLPMCYTSRSLTAAQTRRLAAACVTDIRTNTGDPTVPVHVIAGVTDSLKAWQLKAAARGARDAGAAGFSLYNLETTSVADWGAIDVFRGTAP